MTSGETEVLLKALETAAEHWRALEKRAVGRSRLAEGGELRVYFLNFQD